MTQQTLRLLGLVAVALALLALPAVQANAEDTETTTEGTVELGAWDASDDGSPDVVTEYEPNDGGPDAAVEIESRGTGGSFALDARVRDDDDFDLGIDFDVRRMVRSQTRYTGLPHRLVHDDIDNLAAVTDHGRVVRETDLDPAAVYGIDYELLEHRTELQFPR
ncbi:MAG: GSU2204 family outer membrane beta-barrel protein, partial [Acidobacteriota bacterium]